MSSIWSRGVRTGRAIRGNWLAVLFLSPALAGCFHSAATLRAARRVNYWGALAELHSADAVAAARTPSEREFAQALGNLLAGDVDAASNAFGKLRLTATDSIIRAGSRVLYTATLQYQEKWQELVALSAEPGTTKLESVDRASIESWAGAFRGVPAKSLTFRSSSLQVSMSVSAVGTPLVPVRIGRKTYNFWLDTGSSMTMLASDVAAELQVTPLTSDTLEIVTATGRVQASPALIPQMEIGQVVVKNAPTMIVDESLMIMRELKPMEISTPFKIDGIIGFDVIRSLDIEVDFEESTVRLRNPATSRRDSNRNMFWVGLPVVRINANDGTPLHFGLDTGAQLTFVTETLLDKLQLRAGRIETRRVGGLGGEISLRAPILPDLRVNVRGYPILFKGAVVRAPVYQVLASLDGVIGGDIWNAGMVRIDMTNGVFAIRRVHQGL